jgi:hypothetical protein
MARMLNAMYPDFCPVCRAPAGYDCPSIGRSKKSVRYMERRQWRKEYD